MSLQLCGGIKKDSLSPTQRLERKKWCQQSLWPRNSHRFMMPGAWTPSMTPGFKLWKLLTLQLIESDSRSSGVQGHLLNLFQDLRRTSWLAADFRKLYWVLHFPFLTRKLTRMPWAAGSEWQGILLDVYLQPWRGQGQPMLFLLMDWRWPTWARNELSQVLLVRIAFLY